MSLQSRSVNVSSKTRRSCGYQVKVELIRFCRAPRDDPRAMAKHDCPIFFLQRSSKLSTSTTTTQTECELKSAPICSACRRLCAKLCEYVPLQCCQWCMQSVLGRSDFFSHEKASLDDLCSLHIKCAAPPYKCMWLPVIPGDESIHRKTPLASQWLMAWEKWFKLPWSRPSFGDIANPATHDIGARNAIENFWKLSKLWRCCECHWSR